MIKPEEVRIGNLVMYEGKEYTIHVISDEMPCLDTHEFGIGVVSWDKLQPIPITEEWLLRAGFEIRGGSGGGYYLNGLYIITIDKNFLVNIELYDGWYDTVTSEELSHIKHIHTLQNILHALTGTELTFKTEI